MAIGISSGNGSSETINRMLPSRFLSCSTGVGRSSGTLVPGVQFWVTGNQSCIGAEMYHVASGSETATATLFNSAGTVLAQGSLAVSTTGVHSIYFTTPVTLVATARYRIGVYTPGFYTSGTSTYSLSVPTSPYYAGGGIMIEAFNNFASVANGNPTSSAAGRFGIGPLVI